MDVISVLPQPAGHCHYNKDMHKDTVNRLLALNQVFYETFGGAFAATRRRLQPGIQRVLEQLQPQGDWLDLGCGSGTLAAAWVQAGYGALYTGLDFSESLLREARKAVAEAVNALLSAGSVPQPDFFLVDLLQPGWEMAFNPAGFTGVLSFAVLHHIPGSHNRQHLLTAVKHLLKPGGTFIFSVWQFQHSPRLMARLQPWQLAGLDETELEPGDSLLDWRHALPGQAEQSGLRYVHLFNRQELADLAATTGFKLVDEFESDGKGGRLALYQTWQSL